MPIASIIVPAFNSATTLPATLDALLAQTFDDYEIIVVNDGSTDITAQILHTYTEHKHLRVVSQRNRGLAGARNSGIAAARGAYIGFCDADDLWASNKLERHVLHLSMNPEIGVSFSGSEMIDASGNPLGVNQMPRLWNISPAHIFKRNPIGNGSAPVIRREVFEEIAYRPHSEQSRDWYFDETFRQSEDIECWLRIALTTDWVFEGIGGLLTKYRIMPGGLSAATHMQLAAWEQMVAKLTSLDPEFFKQNAGAARAYQLRYLARRAISDKDTPRARRLLAQSFSQSWRIIIEEPRKTATTLAALVLLQVAGPLAVDLCMGIKGART